MSFIYAIVFFFVYLKPIIMKLHVVSEYVRRSRYGRAVCVRAHFRAVREGKRVRTKVAVGSYQRNKTIVREHIRRSSRLAFR